MADDYPGFDVAESKARSIRWIDLGDVDRSRIGRKSYWELFVVPRLLDQQEADSDTVDNIGNREEENIGEQRVRSEEARRRLKLTTCDLAHAREAGTLVFKKVGNSYLYRMPDRNSNEE
ncbi:MAG: hypothetical protein MUC83_13355 [Pirellula sp.]|nr:hypothetical protein [Pirellula sp.]